MMNLIKKFIPDDTCNLHRLCTPSTAGVSLDTEALGLIWVYYYFKAVNYILPGGLRFEIHVTFERVNEAIEQEEDDLVEVEEGLEELQMHLQRRRQLPQQQPDVNNLEIQDQEGHHHQQTLQRHADNLEDEDREGVPVGELAIDINLLFNENAIQ